MASANSNFNRSKLESPHGFSTHFLKPLGLAPLRAGTISKLENVSAPASYPSACSEQHESDRSDNDQAFAACGHKGSGTISATFGAFHLINVPFDSKFP